MTMCKNYEIYSIEQISKDLLDTIKVGDLIKINEWSKPLRVKGVSENYFVMTTKEFGKCIYSVCEKKPCEFTYNKMEKGKFHVGTDGWTFGSSVWLKYSEYGEYDFENIQAVNDYLNTFEQPKDTDGHSFISHRTSIPITKLSVKRSVKSDVHK